MKDRSDDPSHHERTLLPRSYISLPLFVSILQLKHIGFISIVLPQLVFFIASNIYLLQGWVEVTGDLQGSVTGKDRNTIRVMDHSINRIITLFTEHVLILRVRNNWIFNPISILKRPLVSGVTGGIAARGQIYMGAPISVVEIHLQLEIAAPVKVPPGAPTPLPPPFAPPLLLVFI